MERYFYHGITEDKIIPLAFNRMFEIIKSGEIKARNISYTKSDLEYERYNHVCLYKKNEDYDYDSDASLIDSARCRWIDHGFVFIINPDIEADKVKIGETVGFDENGIARSHLVDEWRSRGGILLDKIVGVALPFDSIIEEQVQLKQSFLEYFGVDLIEVINRLKQIAESFNWIIANSDEKNFTDKLDEQLNCIKRINP